jgi:hypothetical protein
MDMIDANYDTHYVINALLNQTQQLADCELINHALFLSLNLLNDVIRSTSLQLQMKIIPIKCKRANAEFWNDIALSIALSKERSLN